MRDFLDLSADLHRLARNLHRYGSITDRTDFIRDGKHFTEFVIRLNDVVWNITMVDGDVKQIMKV